MLDFDVIVLGGGSAGTAAARSASRAGARTAMLNDGELGGLCILRGCMPTKAMLASAHAIHEARNLEPFGAHLEGRVSPSFPAIMSRKNAQVARFQHAKIQRVREEGYEVVLGRARFVPGGGVQVGERTLRARRYVIATGSIPVFPDVPGIETVPALTSDEVMRLSSQPASLLVYGAGPTGLELAQFFARIGTEVLLVNRSPLFARHDPEAGAELLAALREEPRLETAIPCHIEHVRAQGPGLVARLRGADATREHYADALLCATGRRPALEGLGLEHVGLRAIDGVLEHDEHMRSANPDVLVAGDVTGKYQVLHLANQEAEVAGQNAAGMEPPRSMDYRLEMAVVFTDPPFARVGMTRVEADAAGPAVVRGVARFPETGRAITAGVRHGMWQMFVDRSSCEILGSSIVGPRADDLIHTLAVLMHFRAGADIVPRLPWYHPTFSEVILNVERDLVRQLESCPQPILPPA